MDNRHLKTHLFSLWDLRRHPADPPGWALAAEELASNLRLKSRTGGGGIARQRQGPVKVAFLFAPKGLGSVAWGENPYGYTQLVVDKEP